MLSQIIHRGFFFCFFIALLLGYASAFHGIVAVPLARHSRPHTHSSTSLLKAESGELSISEELPPLDPEWIKAARKPFSWEKIGADAAVVPDDVDDSSSWQNGQRWSVTRQALMDMWVLPQAMPNGSSEDYANAAIRGEEKVLQQVPQLLRLESDAVLESARTVLNDLQLPPALLRKEPILLTMDPDRLRGGFERIRISSESSPVEACRDTPGLLLEAATEWIKSDSSLSEDAAVIIEDNDSQDFPEKTTTDSIQLLQQSFDNEVSADDLHMESFLDSKNED